MADSANQVGTGSKELPHYLSAANVWALSLGGAVGWGAFVMPATTLIPKAGPIGAMVAMVIAGLVVLVIAANFHFMSNRYPDSGGAFAFVKHTFGYDHAFLAAWALILAYISIMWANATAVVLLSRFLAGSVFQFGFHYMVAGYDVYFGEILLTIGVFLAFGLFSCIKKSVVKAVNTAFAFVMVLGVLGCFFAVLAHSGGNQASFDPAFMPTGDAPVIQMLGIVVLTPWAFLGFESISHGAGEFNFPPKRLFLVMALAILAGTMIYVLMTAVSVIGMPAEYSSWFDYIEDLGNLEGLKGLPAFYAVQESMGKLGIAFLGITIFAAIATTLISLYRASSRLMYSLAQESVLPEWFGRLNDDGVPRNALMFIMVVSFIVPFVGRAAIGWIVDVTTVSAAIVYGYASLCCVRVGRREDHKVMLVTGTLGALASAVFLIVPLTPFLWSVSALASESYLILAAWSMVGLFLFRVVFTRDRENHFGRSTIVWIAMVFIILFSSTMWMRQITHDVMTETVSDISTYYAQGYEERGIIFSEETFNQDEQFLEHGSSQVSDTLMNGSLFQLAFIVFSLALMFNIYALMRKREREIDMQRAEAEQATQAKSVFLSNMSHDIRTPMNAILGYTHLARSEDVTLDEMKVYLDKIDGSSKHLLALINDVLEMSRIESGQMEIDPQPCDLCKTMGEVRDMFATQMAEKNIVYTVNTQSVRNPYVKCDSNRLNRVLLNLISNAYKFTPDRGSVAVTLTQDPLDAVDGMASFELRVKDSGIGMTPEFAARVFEAFERERNSTVSGIQGTGLGMAITKSIVDLMGGTIDVVTAPGEGTEFIVRIAFQVLTDEEAASLAGHDAGEEEAVDFTGKRILLVEDNEINREIAMLILEDAGFELDEAENGKIAVEKVAASQPGYYDIVLMDVQMPVMNGYEATRAIRQLDNPELANVPIVAASANAFAEDVQAAHDAGMNGHIAKPLDVPKVMRVLSEILEA